MLSNKMIMSTAPPSIDLRHLKWDATKPHPFLRHLGGIDVSCEACLGSRSLPIHDEPLGGWPK